MDLADQTLEYLHQHADHQKAQGMQAYMRDQFVYLGVSTKMRDEWSRELYKHHWTRDQLLEFVNVCFQTPIREMQNIGVRMLRKKITLLQANDLGCIKYYIETQSWWDTVDEIASQVLGPFLKIHNLENEMDTWIKDQNLWVRRSAILHQLHYKDQTDAHRLFAYCERCQHETDFFIRKAIGWALRQYARQDPQSVKSFVKDHPQLSGLSRREALKHLA